MPDIHAFAAATGAIRSYQTAFREGKKEKAEEEYLKAKRFLDALTTGGNIQEQRQRMQIAAGAEGRTQQLFGPKLGQAKLAFSEEKIAATDAARLRTAKEAEAQAAGFPSEPRRVAELGVEAGEAERVAAKETIERGAVRAEAGAVRKEADVEAAQAALAKGQAQLATMEVQAQTALEEMLGAKTRSLLSALAQVELAGAKSVAEKADLQLKIDTGYFEQRMRVDAKLMGTEVKQRQAQIAVLESQAAVLKNKKLMEQAKKQRLEERDEWFIAKGYDPAMVDAHIQLEKAGLGEIAKPPTKIKYSQELRMISATLANIQRSATIKEATTLAQEQIGAPTDVATILLSILAKGGASSLSTPADKARAEDTIKRHMNFVLKLAESDYEDVDWESLTQELSVVELDVAKQKQLEDELREFDSKGQ